MLKEIIINYINTLPSPAKKNMLHIIESFLNMTTKINLTANVIQLQQQKLALHVQIKIAFIWLYYPKQSIDSMQIDINRYQATNSIFHRTRTNNFTICMEIQKTLNSQSNLEKEEWNWRNQPA